MTPPVIVPKGERGIIRLFSLSMTDDEAQELRDDPAALNAAFGVDDLDPNYTEVFAVADLDELGLAVYLTEGNGAQADEVKADAAKLAALDGWVIVMFSQALGGRGATLSPDHRLTLIGSYTEEGVDWSPQKIEAGSAMPFSGQATKPVPGQHKAPRGLIWGMLILAAGLFVLFFIRQG